MGLWRDSSQRLTFDQAGVTSEDYPRLCSLIADAFCLAPSGNVVIGLDQMSWDFQLDDLVISLDWDVWMEFMIVSQSAASERLVTEIAAWIELHWTQTA